MRRIASKWTSLLSNRFAQQPIGGDSNVFLKFRADWCFLIYHLVLSARLGKGDTASFSSTCERLDDGELRRFRRVPAGHGRDAVDSFVLCFCGVGSDRS
jgi:hypothetical protein